MTLSEQYKHAVTHGKIQYDEHQWRAVQVLQKTLEALQKPAPFFSFGKKIIPGVYLYGRVGTGKTYLMDCFFYALTLKKKWRLHFYKFMEMVHEELGKLSGHKDPLKVLAKNMAKKAKVICFDEFFVTNIVDAMVLGGLFTALYEEKMTIVMTSNTIPDELYKDGLQREQFLPAIRLIEKNNVVIPVDSGIDYRERKFDYDRAYVYPQDADNKEILLSRFRELAGSKVEIQASIHLNDRTIPVMYQGKKAIWFDFLILCGVPRGPADYIALSEQCQTIFLSGVRHIGRGEQDLICNFIRFIDVLYDAHVKLMIMASVPMAEIYTEGLHVEEFQRTQSRLWEMQSQDYLK